MVVPNRTGKGKNHDRNHTETGRGSSWKWGVNIKESAKEFSPDWLAQWCETNLSGGFCLYISSQWPAEDEGEFALTLTINGKGTVISA